MNKEQLYHTKKWIWIGLLCAASGVAIALIFSQGKDTVTHPLPIDPENHQLESMPDPIPMRPHFPDPK